MWRPDHSFTGGEVRLCKCQVCLALQRLGQALTDPALGPSAYSSLLQEVQLLGVRAQDCVAIGQGLVRAPPAPPGGAVFTPVTPAAPVEGEGRREKEREVPRGGPRSRKRRRAATRSHHLIRKSQTSHHRPSQRSQRSQPRKADPAVDIEKQGLRVHLLQPRGRLKDLWSWKRRKSTSTPRKKKVRSQKGIPQWKTKKLQKRQSNRPSRPIHLLTLAILCLELSPLIGQSRNPTTGLLSSVGQGLFLPIAEVQERKEGTTESTRRWSQKGWKRREDRGTLEQQVGLLIGMPPKRVGRPAAKVRARAKAAPKAAPKRAPRAPRLRPGVRRRPAAAVGGGKVEVKLRELGVEALLKTGPLEVKGRYWEAEILLAGSPVSVEQADGEIYVILQVTGTKSENLLRYLSGTTTKRIKLHLCKDPCGALVWSDDLVHLVEACQGGAAEDWVENAKEVRDPAFPKDEDQLAALREEARQEGLELGRREADRARSRSPARKKEKKKDKDEEARRSKNIKEMKARPRKAVEALFGATGLDPDPEVRTRFMRKGRKAAEKKKKKKKKDKGGSSSSSGRSKVSSCSGSGEEAEMDTETLFGEQSAAKKISKRAPGVLAAAWLKEAQDYLLTSQGMVWSTHQQEVQPLAVQYFRSQMSGVLKGPVAREYHTLVYAVDLALQGRAAEMMDLLIQRLKSLSSTQSGVHYSISQKMELLPVDKNLPAALEETQAAAEAWKKEERVYKAAKGGGSWTGSQGSEQPKGKGKNDKGGKKGKGKDWKDWKGREDPKGGGDPKK